MLNSVKDYPQRPEYRTVRVKLKRDHSCPVLPTVVRISLDNLRTVFGISPDNPVTCNTCIYYIGHAVVHVYVLELTKDPLECTSAQAGSFIVQAL